jgi:putative transposase
VLGSERKALATAGISRSTWHYRRNPGARVAGVQVPHDQRAYPNQLTDQESDWIAEAITAGRRQGWSVGQCFVRAWDQGVMLGSRRTWHRIAARMAAGQCPGLERRAVRPARAKPVVGADGPGQVWSWDITDLPSVYSRVAYKLYAVMDIYGRPIVAWRVEEREADHLAAQMFAEAIAIHGAPQVVHSDSGAAMRSRAVKDVLAAHGVQLSFIRPRVSNDNPFSESVFSMLKSRPDYPGFFQSLEHARAWAAGQVEYYNHEHRHSRLGWFTAWQVHTGAWEPVWQDREDTLQDYYQARPERFRARPVTPRPATVVGINMPAPEATDQ